MFAMGMSAYLFQILKILREMQRTHHGRLSMFLIAGPWGLAVLFEYILPWFRDLMLWYSGLLIEMIQDVRLLGEDNQTFGQMLNEVRDFIAPGMYTLDQYIDIGIISAALPILLMLWLYSVVLSWILSVVMNIGTLGTANT